MKAGYLAVAAAMAVGVLASNHQAHGHALFHKERGLAASPANCTCGSYTSWVTTYAEMTLHNPPPPAPTTTSSSSCPPPVAPTPLVTTCPTPGVYTIPATTMTVTSTTTVCAATSTSVPAGTHTIGGVTTVVLTSTTVVCPVATTKTESGVVTSHIVTTTYVCPSAGTYTIAPITTTCVSSGIIVYPVPASYSPGTYTQPEVVTTITETDYVVFCPYTSSSAPTSTSAPAAPATSAMAVPTSSSAPAPSQSSSPPSLGNNGKQWAITYTPYDTVGNCKSASDVLVDITAIKGKGFSVVRIYSTDCSGLQNVGAACSAVGLKMILGVFIDQTGISGAQGQVTDIVAWAQWSLVELIVIGNECIFGGHCQPQDLVNFIQSCKTAFSGAGYTGPCTTTEPLSTLQDNKDLICEVVDIVGANIHAFFNGGILAAAAGDFVCGQELAAVEQLCPGKKAINLETGWPSSGPCNGVSCTGDDNQQQAIDSIMGACGGQSVLFSYVDDKWKTGEWEQSFGCGKYFNN